MITDDEILEALGKGLQIIPFLAYSQYRNGHLHKDDCLGVRYTCVMCDTEAVVAPDDFYLGLEVSASGARFVGTTPREAIDNYMAWWEEKDAERKERDRRLRASLNRDAP